MVVVSLLNMIPERLLSNSWTINEISTQLFIGCVHFDVHQEFCFSVMTSDAYPFMSVGSKNFRLRLQL